MLARAFAGHLSIRDAADKCGIGRGAWTNWEKGARPVEMVEIATAISEGLGVDRDWLIFGGPLAKPEAARRRDRHGRRQITNWYPQMTESTSPGPARPAVHRPSSGPGKSGPNPATRRPALVGAALYAAGG